MLELLLTFAAAACAIPADLVPAPVHRSDPPRIVATTRMTLAYYWWPEQCRRGATEAAGCASSFGFKVHGLWPDGANRMWPQYCRAPTQVDLATLRATYCTTPSPGLIQHEWAKHGTCGWATPGAYFADARRIAATIALPDVDRLPGAGLTAGRIRDAVVAANPRLPRASLFIATDRKLWLRELRVCLTTAYRPVACPGIGAPDRVPVRVWPR